MGGMVGLYGVSQDVNVHSIGNYFLAGMRSVLSALWLFDDRCSGTGFLPLAALGYLSLRVNHQ